MLLYCLIFRYADGEIEWIDSSIEVFEIIPPSTPVKTQSTLPSQSSMLVEKSVSAYPTQSSTLPTQISSIPTQSSTLPTQLSSISSQSSATSTPQKDAMHSVEAAIRKLSPATRKKSILSISYSFFVECAQLRRLLDSSEEEEEGYVPKENEEEESDDSLSMDVESEDEPIAGSYLFNIIHIS